MSEENEKEEESGTSKRGRFPPLPAELSLLSKVLADYGASFSWMTQLADQYARVGAMASEIVANLPVPQVLQIERAMSDTLTRVMANLAPLQGALKEMQTIQSILGSIKLPELTFAVPKRVFFDVTPSIGKLRDTVSELAYIRERVDNHEERIQALEGVVKKLRELLEDPELPEKYRTEVRELLVDLQKLGYVA